MTLRVQYNVCPWASWTDVTHVEQHRLRQKKTRTTYKLDEADDADRAGEDALHRLEVAARGTDLSRCKYTTIQHTMW